MDTSAFFNEFISFNRETWLAEKERQNKEDTWEQELLAAMSASCSGYTLPAAPSTISEAEQEIDKFLTPVEDEISQKFLPSYRPIRSQSLCAKINLQESPVVNQMAKSFPM